jgi:hypothetical protein
MLHEPFYRPMYCLHRHFTAVFRKECPFWWGDACSILLILVWPRVCPALHKTSTKCVMERYAVVWLKSQLPCIYLDTQIELIPHFHFSLSSMSNEQVSNSRHYWEHTREQDGWMNYVLLCVIRNVFLGVSGHGCVDIWSSEMGNHRGGAEDRHRVKQG